MASYNVQRLPSGKWRARYRDHAKRERSKAFDRKRDAEAWAAEEIRKLNRGEWTDPREGQVTVGEYAPEWLSSKVKIKPATRDNYASILDTHILPAWGGIPLSAVRHEEVASWIRTLADGGLSASRIRQAYIVLNQILDLAVRARRIAVNPVHGVELPSLPGKSERPDRVLSEDELWLLADEAGDQALPIHVMGWCGLRFGEVAALKVSEFDALRRELYVNRTLSEVGGELREGPAKTKTSIRRVPVPSWLADLLAAQMEGKGPDDRLVTMPEGGPLRLGNWRGRVFDPAIKRAGIASQQTQACHHVHVVAPDGVHWTVRVNAKLTATSAKRDARCRGLRGGSSCDQVTALKGKGTEAVAAAALTRQAGSVVGIESVAGGDMFRPHDLRHTCASLHIKAGTPAKHLSEMLGHSSVAFTLDRYGHLYPGDLNRMVDSLGESAAARRAAQMRHSDSAQVVQLDSGRTAKAV